MDITIKNATFSWNEQDKNDLKNDIYLIDIDHNTKKLIGERELEEENSNSYILENINFTAPGCKLTVIVGPIGSGKTSLVSSLIGEIHKVKGEVNVPRNLSFTSQQPFLISASLRENILFGKEMDLDRYKKVIDACCLAPDLLQFSAKDLTEIGERGINLSGGQKQRISLARALYSNSDCYIMDEPLSAVDPEVASHLFDHCIQGMMSNKTRILVTHQLQFIPSADQVVVLDNGKLIQGTYKELKEKGIDFESIMKTKKLNVDCNDLEFINEQANVDILQPAESSNENGLKKSTLLEVSKNIDLNTLISDDHDLDLIEKAKLLVQEDRNKGDVGLSVYKSYFKYGSSAPFFFATIFTFFISQLIFQASDFWLQFWSQQKFIGKSDSFYIGYYLLFIGIFVVFLIIRYFMLARLTFSSSKNLHSQLLKSVGGASSRFFDINPSGRIMNRFSKDISDVDLILLELFSDVLYCGFSLIVAILVMIYAAGLLISIPFTFLIGVYYLVQKLYEPPSRELKRLESITRSPIFSLLSETYNGLVTIRAYQQQQRFYNIMKSNISINLRLFYYSFSVHRWIGIRIEFLSSLTVLLTAIFSLFNPNSGFSVLAITTALGLTGVLNWAVRQSCELVVKMNSVERIKSYIEIPREGTFYNIDQQNYNDDAELDGKWPSNGEIEFKNVEIKYSPTADPSLKNLSFKIKAKEHIGVVGRTGAGKSTVGISLFRMVECSKGAIFIDGVDISKIGLHQLRSSIGVVPQDPFIFSGSIRANIDPENKFTNSEIHDALDKVKLRKVISKMPLKLETQLQENGDGGFSFGQKQLLCLTRVVLKKAKVILMDECTSAIDYKTAELIKQFIHENFNNCTMLTIAHRLDTIIDSDKIAVISRGELIEYDTPTNLIKTEGSQFRKIVKYQTDFHTKNEKNF